MLKDIMLIVGEDGHPYDAVPKDKAEDRLKILREAVTYEELKVIPAADIITAPDSNVILQIEQLFGNRYDMDWNDRDVIIKVYHGDHRHDHGFLDELMKKIFGMECYDEIITEDSDEDNYSSEHHYKLS